MSDAGALFISILFWALAAAVAFAPQRWSLLAYLAVIHLDLSGPGWASPTAIGLENAIKVGLLPTIMLARTRFEAVSLRWGWPFRLWLAFCAYAVLAGLWGPFPVSAGKFAVYLYAYTATFLVFAHAWRRRLIDFNLVVAGLWTGLLLGVAQTYVFGNTFGAPPKMIVEEERFTSFSAPQSYAGLLVAYAALLAFLPAVRSSSRALWLRVVSSLGLFGGLFLTGSRYAMLGMGMLIGVVWLSYFVMQTSRRGRVKLLIPAGAGILALVALVGLLAVVAPNNRIFDLADLVANGRLNLDAIGTFRWRIGVYETALTELRQRDALGLIFGSGTSSAANVVLRYNPTAFPVETIDANRAMHSEFLRAFYEWGIIGFGLFVAFVLSLPLAFIRATRTARSGLLAFWAFLPTMLLGLAMENVLAGSGGPVGTGLALVTAAAAAAMVAVPDAVTAEESDARPARPQLLPTAGR